MSEVGVPHDRDFHITFDKGCSDLPSQQHFMEFPFLHVFVSVGFEQSFSLLSVF